MIAIRDDRSYCTNIGRSAPADRVRWSGSLRRFRWLQPIVIDSKDVIAAGYRGISRRNSFAALLPAPLSDEDVGVFRDSCRGGFHLLRYDQSA